MTGPELEVADIIRTFGDAFLDAYGDTLTPQQRRVLLDLPRCRTAALGGHVEGCDQCGYQRIAYHSCRNRHCPKCQGTAAARWVEARAADLLPVEYFHVVFTLPAALGPLALQNPQVVYGLLFHAAAETLQQVAADPKHLGAEIGVLAVLPTWGQNLHHHPHVHGVVPGGGLSADGTRWISSPPGFLLPVRVRSRVFRGKFLSGLRAAYDRGELRFPGTLGACAEADQFHQLLAGTTATDWVVYAKPPFGGPEQVLKYLGRYTHRVAISNRRLVDVEEGRVRFRYKDYVDSGRERVMSLEALEFLRRFLMHVLPLGFVRIRSYGLLSNCHRREKLELCRRLLGVDSTVDLGLVPGVLVVLSGLAEAWHAAVCPACGAGRMVILRELPRVREVGEGGNRVAAIVAFDTS